jgi:MFS family permease
VVLGGVGLCTSTHANADDCRSANFVAVYRRNACGGRGGGSPEQSDLGEVCGSLQPSGNGHRRVAGCSHRGGALFLGVLPASFQNPYAYCVIFVLLGFAEAGVLLGRKTFLIDQVDAAERTTYVAFGNTVMGVVTLLFGFIGILAQYYGIRSIIAIFILLGFTGAAVSFLLPETSSEQKIAGSY